MEEMRSHLEPALSIVGSSWVVAGSIDVKVLDDDVLGIDDDTSPELGLDDGKVLDHHVLGILNG